MLYEVIGEFSAVVKYPLLTPAGPFLPLNEHASWPVKRQGFVLQAISWQGDVGKVCESRMGVA